MKIDGTAQIPRFNICLHRIARSVFAILFFAAQLAFSQNSGGRKEKDPNPVICIDPGHSKKTIGARGKHLLEYQVCWQMALLLRDRLLARGAKVIMTRDNEDEHVELDQRAAIANKAKANLFIRLHCDAAEDTGIATYYPERAGSINGKRGPSPEIISASRRAAQVFHSTLIRNLGGELRDRGLKTDSQTDVGARQGALTGSIYAEVPVFLVEMAVITNSRDEEYLESPTGSLKLADAMAAGALAACQKELPEKPVR